MASAFREKRRSGTGFVPRPKRLEGGSMIERASMVPVLNQKRYGRDEYPVRHRSVAHWPYSTFRHPDLYPKRTSMSVNETL